MTINDWIIAGLTTLGILIIPLVAFLFRGIIKWTRVEDRLGDIAQDLKEIVEDKERIHKAIYDEMKADRQATDRRLRWLEEWHMRHGERS